jgi:hypothetical protein
MQKFWSINGSKYLFIMTTRKISKWVGFTNRFLQSHVESSSGMAVNDDFRLINSEQRSALRRSNKKHNLLWLKCFPKTKTSQMMSTFETKYATKGRRTMDKSPAERKAMKKQAMILKRASKQLWAGEKSRSREA